MNDIEKLHKVIVDLEEQSSQLSEFSGVLSAINLAKSELISAKATYDKLQRTQTKFVSDNQKKLGEYNEKLSLIYEKLSEIESTILTTERFDVGFETMLHKIEDLKMVTPEQLERDLSSLEGSVLAEIAKTSKKNEALIALNIKAIKNLRVFVVLSLLLLAGWMAFLL